MRRTRNVRVVCEKWIILCYCTALLFTLLVQAHRLEFTVEPSDVVVIPEGSAILNCAAQLVDGTLTQPVDSKHISWQTSDDGQRVPYLGDIYRSQLKNGSLYISKVIEGQELTGGYRCVATLNSVGILVSRNASVRLASLSGFEQEPRDLTLFPGQSAYMTCIAAADPPAVIRWLKDERSLFIDESRMTLLPSGALEIDDVQSSDQGSYRCNASGLNQYRLSNKATLTLNKDLEYSNIVSPPSFIAIPKSVVARVTETVTFDCAAVGNPHPWITWLKNGVTIDMADLDSPFKKIGSGTLQITNVEESHAGMYQCRADNGEDAVDVSASLEVQVPPKFIKKPQDARQVIKKDIEFECDISGNPEPVIQWYKNGEKIKYNDYLKLVNGYNLQILGLMVIDAGIFQCMGSNPAGNVQASAVLTIIEANNSLTTEQPTKFRNTIRYTRNKNPRNPFAHSALSSLKSDEIRQPKRNSRISSQSDDLIGIAEFGSFKNSKEYVMRHPKLSFDPKNILTSLKEGGGPNEDLGEANFAYTGSPLFPPDGSLSAGESSVLTEEERETGTPSEPKNVAARIVSARFVTLSWETPEFTNGEIISYQVAYRQKDSHRERTQLTMKPSLEEINISGLNPGCIYYFEVTAYNQKGAGKPSEPLEVETQSEEHVPSGPKNLKAVATSATSILVEWDEPDITNGLIQRYKVYYIEGSTEHNIVTSDIRYELSGLQIYTEYHIWVVAINQNGPGSASNEIIVKTLSASPSAPPNNVTVEVSSSTSIVVRWEPPPLEHQNGIITGYKVRYKRQGGGTGKAVTADANKRIHFLNNLDRAVSYQVKVQALNVNGSGPWSEWLSVDTYENDLVETQVPDPPESLGSRPLATSIVIMWNPPKNSNIKVRSYMLGWGNNVPNVYTEQLDGKQRFYEIKNLQPDTEYVISLWARNEVGDGPPVYTTAKTRLVDEIGAGPIAGPTGEHSLPALFPPIGLKAMVLSPYTVVLYWTDTTLSKNQFVTDNRHYIVKYSSVTNRKEILFNTTDLNCMIDELKPNTQYEFTVKVVKGRRSSDWSMVVVNTTWEAAPKSYPRDLIVMPTDDSHIVDLKWLPPKQANGVIIGYLIQYTTDQNNKDRDWIMENVIGDKHETVVRNLHPEMTYYFKISAKNKKGYGPYSPIVSFTTTSGGKESFLSQNTLLYVVIGGPLLSIVFLSIIFIIFCCKRKSEPGSTPDRAKKGYQKAHKNQNIKPPDLWIHHDQMELKAMEKSHAAGTSGGTSNDGASSSGATTLPRSVGHEYDPHDYNAHASSSLDKRTYVPSYVGSNEKQDDSTNGRIIIKPKPITLPVDSKPPREPIATATPINNTSCLHHGTSTLLAESPSVGGATTIVTPSGLVTAQRPSYPRTQYTISRAHVTLDQSGALESPYAVQQQQQQQVINANSTGYDTGMGLAPVSGNYASLPQQSQQLGGPSGLGGTTGVTKTQVAGAQQGHPLKSFSVPAPPPTSAPGTPAHGVRQHNVAQVNVRPITSSPYKKPLSSSSSLTSATPHLRSNPLSSLSSMNDETRPLYLHHESELGVRPAVVPGEDTKLLANSTSTEELNQEMANLEGLMKDLNAITANEFEC